MIFDSSVFNKKRNSILRMPRVLESIYVPFWSTYGWKMLETKTQKRKDH